MKTMQRTGPLRFLFALALALMIGHAAVAQPLKPLRVEQVESEYRIPLGWLNGTKQEPIELRGADARRTLKLPVSPRLNIEDAKLDMYYTNSISLIPRSLLAVTLDERVLAQLPLKANQPDNAARISLPARSLQPGFRDLGFRAAQHYTLECEDTMAPELFSQVDAVQSMLRLKVSRKALTPSLARLGDVFDRRLWLDRYVLQLMIPPSGLEEHEDLRQAAIQISQSLANTFDFLPMAVNVKELSRQPAELGTRPRSFPGVTLGDNAWDSVVLGTREQLAPYVSQEVLGRITEGYLGLFRSDQDPTRFILVVSGRTPAEVRQAATVLNLPGIALPERQDVLLSSLTSDSGYLRPQPLQVEKGWTTFANLGFRNTYLKGMFTAAELEFWAFREMLSPSQPFLDMQLSYAYGAGFDKKSTLNVLINGQFVQALPLQEVKGEQVFRAKVRIPAIALRPGTNVLRFEAGLIGEDVGGACEPIWTDNLRLTIFEDSRLELPPLADYIRLPDLGLLGKTGLPYTRMADGKGVGLMVADLRPETLGAALTLAAKLRQTHKAPLTAMRFLTMRDDQKGLEGLFVVGTVSAMPESTRQEMTAFMPGFRWQKVRVGSKKGTEIGTGFQRWLENPTAPFAQLTAVENPATATVVLSEGLGESVALVQYVSKTGIPVTVLTAAESTLLQLGAEQLVEFDTWGALDGAAMIWSIDGEAVAKAEAVDFSFVGDAPSLNPLSYFFSDRPWLAAIGVFLLILMSAGLAWWVLRLRQRRLGAQG